MPDVPEDKLSRLDRRGPRPRRAFRPPSPYRADTPRHQTQPFERPPSGPLSATIWTRRLRPRSPRPHPPGHQKQQSQHRHRRHVKQHRPRLKPILHRDPQPKPHQPEKPHHRSHPPSHAISPQTNAISRYLIFRDPHESSFLRADWGQDPTRQGGRGWSPSRPGASSKATPARRVAINERIIRPTA